MRRRKYLNAMLTFNAAALALLVTILVADRGPLAPAALAGQPRAGIPDAGSQRLEMIRELRRLNANIDALRKSIEKREFEVKVISMPPVRIEGE